MAIRYQKGDMFCGKCGERIPREEISKQTHRDKIGRLLHECGWAVRIKSRRHNNMESVREDARNHRPITLPHTIKQDILLNKEKLERRLKENIQ